MIIPHTTIAAEPTSQPSPGSSVDRVGLWIEATANAGGCHARLLSGDTATTRMGYRRNGSAKVIRHKSRVSGPALHWGSELDGRPILLLSGLPSSYQGAHHEQG